MACGVPIVSTKCGGPEDYVKPGITGFLCENNPNQFARMIEDVCSNRQKRSYMSKIAVEWIRDNASDYVSRRNFLTHLSAYLDKKGIHL